MPYREKSKNRKSDRVHHDAAKNLLSPNRTSDESPSGAQDLTRKPALRDPNDAPGQLPNDERHHSEPDADESYGQTIIPVSVRPKASRHKRSPQRNTPLRKPRT